MPKPNRVPKKQRPTSPDRGEVEVDLRIIGGKYRGTKLVYEPFVQAGRKREEGPDAVVTRPMKHRVREAIFNLVGLEAKGKQALDLFAGTGALGLEALSRGAESTFFIERHVPTAGVVRQNIAAIRAEDRCKLLLASAFVWSKRDLPQQKAEALPPPGPWLAFVSPPYDFFIERQEEMLDLIAALREHAPPESMIVVEADTRFDFTLLGPVMETRYDTGCWDVRPYPPAVVGVWRV